MKVIAHRGASGYAPENTMASFQKAMEMNVEAVEFDVQMTKDGKLVVIHDYYVDNTTNGKGLVIDYTYEELSKLDAGSWFDGKFCEEKIPLLDEVLDIIPSTVEVHLELKKLMLEKRDLAGDVYKVIKEKGMLKQVLFSSFDHELLKKLRSYDDVKIGALFNTNLINPVKYLKDVALNDKSINTTIIFTTKELVEQAHAEDLLVYTFTVNDEKILDYCKDIDVDGIFTNFPDIMEQHY